MRARSRRPAGRVAAEERSRIVTSLEERLGYHFRDRRLLEEALTHRSYSYEEGGGPEGSYERLELLGDALLGFLVSEWLFGDDPGASEGTLTRRKQAVVCTDTLAAAARKLELGETLRLGRGEESTGGREKPSILADVFEAVLGAVFVAGGVRASRPFLRRHLGQSLRESRNTQSVVDDHKTHLQERAQARLRQTPRYQIVSTEGPAHAPEFEAAVLVGDRVLASGRGFSRKQAEQEAARRALDVLDGAGD